MGAIWQAGFMRILVFFLTATFASLALAETPMTADEFDRYTRGKTLYFSSNGERYGGEEYFENRRVRWSYLDGQCKEGVWFVDGADICFVYEDNPTPQCWQFFLDGGGLSARFTGDEADSTLYEIEGADEEMLCLGPEVGV